MTLAPHFGSVLVFLLFAGTAATVTGEEQGQDQGQQDAALTDVDRRVLKELVGTRTTPRAVFHFAPDALDAAALDADVAANVAALEQLEQMLQVKYRGAVHVFLHRDIASMRRLTDVGEGTVAFSTGTVSVHQPHDFRGVHEFVHIYALQFDRPADTSGPDLFAVEGLATWFAATDEGVPIHSWAACHLRVGVLPPLAALRRTFPDGAPPNVHPYHVAGSFVGFLVERFGIEKVKQWYMDSSEAHAHFGVGIARLEREWRESLASRQVEPEHARHVFARLGRGEPLPAAWAKAEATPLFDGTSMQGLVPEDTARWSVHDAALIGHNDAPWTHLATTREFPATIGVRARLVLRTGNAVKLQLPGGKEAIFATWSSYASNGEGFAANDAVRIEVGRPVEIVAVNDRGRARIFLDGRPVFDLPSAWPTEGKGPLGIGVEKGTVVVTEWSTFAPR